MIASEVSCGNGSVVVVVVVHSYSYFVNDFENLVVIPLIASVIVNADVNGTAVGDETAVENGAVVVNVTSAAAAVAAAAFLLDLSTLNVCAVDLDAALMDGVL